MNKNPKNKQKYSGPTSLTDLIQDFLKVKMPPSMGDEVRVFGQWPKAVGPEVSRQAEPKGFKNGILFVETRHPIWTTELQAKSHIIRKKMNEALGSEVVREIHFRLAKY